ncbi:MAG: hypothetical protein R3B92_00300 [Patescibacteria group bacterium]
MKIIAHGGYSSRYQENTLESYKAAIPYNPYALEMDVIFDSEHNILKCFRPVESSNNAGIFTSLNEDMSVYPSFTDLLSALSWEGKVLMDIKNPSIDALKSVLMLPPNIQNSLIVGIRDESLLEFLNNIEYTFETIGLISSLEQVKKFTSQGCTYIRLWQHDLTTEHLNSRFYGTKIWITPGTKTPRTAGDTTLADLLKFNDLGADGVLLNDLELGALFLKTL